MFQQCRKLRRYLRSRLTPSRFRHCLLQFPTAFGTRPTYVAHATLQIEREAPQVVSFDPQSSGGAVVSDPKDPFFRTRYEMLKSRALAE